MPTFYQNYLAMRNTVNVTSGKLIAIWSQSVSGVNADGRLVAFYNIHRRLREMLFYILFRTSAETNLSIFYYLLLYVLILIIIYILRRFFHYNQADSIIPLSKSYQVASTKRSLISWLPILHYFRVLINERYWIQIFLGMRWAVTPIMAAGLRRSRYEYLNAAISIQYWCRSFTDNGRRLNKRRGHN
jgi:hypothetical protein